MSATPLALPGVLRDVRFRRYLVGQTLSRFGTAFSSIALPFAVLSIDRSAAAVGLVLLTSQVPIIAFALVGGVLGDRFSRRLIMLVTDGARTLVQAITALLLVTHVASVWSLCLLQAAAGLGSAMFQPAATGLVPSLAPANRVREASSLLGVSASIASVSALGLAGAVVALATPGIAFAVDAATYAGSTISLALIRSPSLDEAPPMRSRVWQDVTEGWSAVRDHGWLLTYSVHAALLNAITLGPFFVLGPIVTSQNDGGAAAWAAVAMAFATGAIVGNLAILRWQPSRPVVVALAVTFGLTPLLLLLAFHAAVWWLIPAACLAGAQGAVNETLALVTLQQKVDRRLLSRVSSFVTVGELVAAPLGMGLAGVAAGYVGMQAILIFAACWVLASGALALAVPTVWTVTGTAEGRGWGG